MDPRVHWFDRHMTGHRYYSTGTIYIETPTAVSTATTTAVAVTVFRCTLTHYPVSRAPFINAQEGPREGGLRNWASPYDTVHDPLVRPVLDVSGHSVMCNFLMRRTIVRSFSSFFGIFRPEFDISPPSFPRYATTCHRLLSHLQAPLELAQNDIFGERYCTRASARQVSA